MTLYEICERAGLLEDPAPEGSKNMLRNTTRPKMARTSIVALNKSVRRLVRGGMEAPQAVVQAARDAGLELVEEKDESGNLYRTQRNRYVFGWTNGSAGFDDQID